MANYNQTMNQAMFSAMAGLDATEIAKDRGAFFGSILGTFNHIVVGDTIWLQRFMAHPANYKALEGVRHLATPSGLSALIHTNIERLKSARETMDTVIINFIEETTEEDYAYALPYKNTKGKAFKKNFGHLLQHFFNHQTHHRGQASTLLYQAGIDIGTTDLLMIIPDA